MLCCSDLVARAWSGVMLSAFTRSHCFASRVMPYYHSWSALLTSSKCLCSVSYLCFFIIIYFDGIVLGIYFLRSIWFCLHFLRAWSNLLNNWAKFSWAFLLVILWFCQSFLGLFICFLWAFCFCCRWSMMLLGARCNFIGKTF